MTAVQANRFQTAVAAILPEVAARITAASRPLPTERVLWRELSCCILSSQVSYEVAQAAAARLDSLGCMYRKTWDRRQVERVALAALLAPLKVGRRRVRYRFPRIRAAQLAAARSAIRERFGSLAAGVLQREDVREVRASLVREVPGLGPKQASMFLRNIGVTYDLAIIDRHVLRYVAVSGISSPVASPGTLKAYLTQESALRDHASDLGHAVGILDWAIWIVMRAARQVNL